jgi:hypothetical protein
MTEISIDRAYLIMFTSIVIGFATFAFIIFLLLLTNGGHIPSGWGKPWNF